MDTQLAIAIVGAAGTVVSAWLVNRVRKVQATVNGHTDRLEKEITALQVRLEEAEKGAVSSTRASPGT